MTDCHATTGQHSGKRRHYDNQAEFGSLLKKGPTVHGVQETERKNCFFKTGLGSSKAIAEVLIDNGGVSVVGFHPSH